MNMASGVFSAATSSRQVVTTSGRGGCVQNSTTPTSDAIMNGAVATSRSTWRGVGEGSPFWWVRSDTPYVHWPMFMSAINPTL